MEADFGLVIVPVEGRDGHCIEYSDIISTFREKGGAYAILMRPVMEMPNIYGIPLFKELVDHSSIIMSVTKIFCEDLRRAIGNKKVNFMNFDIDSAY